MQATKLKGRANLKRWFADVLPEASETVTDGDEKIVREFDRFIQTPSPLQAEIQARKCMGDPVKFSTKRRLRSAVENQDYFTTDI
jgi:hypothetical protein